MQEPTNIPQTLQAKIAEFTAAYTPKVVAMMKRHKVSKEATAALLEDMQDLVHGQYNGLHATAQDMREISTKITRRAADMTENIALAMVVDFYAQSIAACDGGTLGSLWIEAVPKCEAARISGQQVDEHTRQEANVLLLDYCILCAAEHCDATAAELADITPMGDVPANLYNKAAQARIIATALDNQRQRKAMEAATEQRKRTKALTDMPADRKIKPQAEDTIAQYQNFTHMLAGNIQTADIDGRTGQALALRPLHQALREKEDNATLVLHDKFASEPDKEAAINLMATSTAIYQALDAIQIIPQKYQPDSATTTQTIYTFTPHQLTSIATGTEHPSPEQIKQTMRAFNWLSSQRMQIVEEVLKMVPKKDSSGNALRDGKGRIEKEPRKVKTFTIFNPATARFHGEYGEDAPVLKATMVDVAIDNLVISGRSNEYKEITDENGKQHIMRIAAPTRHIITMPQMYEFSSDEERIFRNIIISTPHMAEDALLSKVFDYPGKQADADAKATAAAQLANSIAACSTSTAAEIQKAEEDAAAAARRAKSLITHNHSRDVEKVKEMFNRAQQCGILQSYYPTIGAGKKGNTWEWKRPTAEDVKKRRAKNG